MPLKSFNTLQYSTMALCFLSIAKEAQPQAVYTDLDPDLIIDNDGEIGNIDINNDGVFDFGFLNSLDTVLTFDYDPQSYLERIWAGPKNPNNAIAGSFNQFTLSYGGLSTYYYPFALASNVSVNAGLSFQTAGYQFMARREFWILSIGTVTLAGGNWYPEINDNYIGVRFLDTAGCNHYGWIRCDVKEEGRTLIIKDYAFETKCDTAILTGDKVGDTTTVNMEDFSILNTKIYAFNSDVYIRIDENPGNYTIRIINLSGALIYADLLRNKWNVISLINEPEGIYFIEIFTGQKKVVSKKIIIN